MWPKVVSVLDAGDGKEDFREDLICKIMGFLWKEEGCGLTEHHSVRLLKERNVPGMLGWKTRVWFCCFLEETRDESL